LSKLAWEESNVKKLLFSVVATIGAIAPLGCGGPSAFGLVSEDNSAPQIMAVLAAHPTSAAPRVRNATGKPLIVVTGGAPKFLAAFDLATQKSVWRVAADVQSRISIGSNYVVAQEGKQLVARDLSTGAVRWQVPLSGALVGASAGSSQVVVVTKRGTSKFTWQVSGLDATSGRSSWQTDSDGELGAPSVTADVAMVPFLSQWLNLLDIKSGKPLARLRGVEDQIAIVRSTSDGAFFGSKKGMIRLDDKAAAGRRADSSFASIKLPTQITRATYGVDAYTATEAMYSAADRTRILWRGPHGGAFEMPHTAVHYFRFVFDFAQDGSLRWAYSHPRVELVASEHIGTSLLAVSVDGNAVALDVDTGAVLQKIDLGLGNVQVAGATFDADGWKPSGSSEPTVTRDALVAIAKDRDARFDGIKELAVAVLAKENGPEVTSALLSILAEPRVSMKLKDQIVDILIRRKDVSAMPALVTALETRYDFVAGTEAAALGPVARAMAGLVGQKIEPAQAAKAVLALVNHLEDPATAISDLDNVIDALSAVGAGREIAALRAHALTYRADSDMASDEPWRLSIINALLRGGPAEVELLRSLADDARTNPTFAQAITQALQKK
jgi:outer membrane protein assembly factor BamB